jgi:penicillin amidase
MDLLRCDAAGELSEVFGEVALDLEKESRTLGMRPAAERAAADSSPENRSLLDAYARGINQYIEERRGRRPLEFTLLPYEPWPWAPSDTYLITLYMYKTLTSTWKSKLNRQWIAEKVGFDPSRDLFYGDSELDVPITGFLPTIRLPKPSGERTTKNSVQRSGAQLGSSSSVSTTGGEMPPFGPPVWGKAQALGGQIELQSSEIIGSNDFVVSGAHTASGRSLLANDTHLGLGVPCIWYIMLPTAPGWNVEGFVLPGAPLVIIGHNDRIAWGFTNSNADVQDLYVATFDPDNSLAYLANGNWLSADVRHEMIHVCGKPDLALDLIVTRHGPIVHRDPPNEGGRAYALRWTALEPGGLEFGFPLLGRARNWDEFLQATRHIAGPGQNTIYADGEGTIAFIVPARIPIRARGNGALPVSGNTDDYEWKGCMPFEELSRTWNPPGGIIATANAKTVGPAYKYYLTDRWAGPYRTYRIYQLLLGRTGLSPADFNSIQNNLLSLPSDYLAKQLITASRTRQPKDPRTTRLIEKLKGWDARATSESAETSFVEYARHALFHDLLAPYLNAKTLEYEQWEPESIYKNVWWRDKEFLQYVLRERPPAWLPSGFASYDDLLIASADQAVAALDKQSRSPELAAWGWGRLHPLDMAHPLGRFGQLLRLLSIGPYAQSGTVDTARAMGVGHGPAMRLVADLSDFNDSQMEMATGEAGQYSSPHLRDQFPEWFAGRGIPAPFSEAAEEKVRAHRLLLLPEKANTSGGQSHP